MLSWAGSHMPRMAPDLFLSRNKSRSEMFPARLTFSGSKAEYHQPVRHSGTPVFDMYQCYTRQEGAFGIGA